MTTLKTEATQHDVHTLSNGITGNGVSRRASERRRGDADEASLAGKGRGTLTGVEVLLVRRDMCEVFASCWLLDGAGCVSDEEEVEGSSRAGDAGMDAVEDSGDLLLLRVFGCSAVVCDSLVLDATSDLTGSGAWYSGGSDDSLFFPFTSMSFRFCC